MSRSTDPGHFFQTDAADANAARKAAKSGNKHGDPIVLPSKILAVVADPTGAEAVYVAESGGTIRRVDLKTKSFKKEVYRGPTAPLTSLCIHNSHIYAGCWDKSIWTWPLIPSTSASHGARSAISTTRPRQYHGHHDFVKVVVCTTLPSAAPNNAQSSQLDILISGAQDAKIIIWNAHTGEKLKTLTGHARGVLSLTLSAFPSAQPDASSQWPNSIDLFSGGSEGQIRCWRITVSDSANSSPHTINAGPLSANLSQAEADALAAAKAQGTEVDVDVLDMHETSVNALLLAGAPALDYDEEDDDSSKLTLYTASSDNTALLLPMRHPSIFHTQHPIAQAYRKPSATLSHPDFVRAIVPLAAPDSHLVATACRDEGVRIWDVSEPGGDLLHCFEGHYEEVTGLAVVGSVVVSISIDGTVRTWPGTRSGVEKAVDVSRRLRTDEDGEDGSEDEAEAGAGAKPVAGGKRSAAKAVDLDSDEEAELAALMEDDD